MCCFDESPHCYLLEIDDFTILLDCGWDELFSVNLVDSLKQNINKIDAVLISYPDLLHLGALPYAVGKLGLNCPIYGTVPVHKMGQMFMYDWYLSRYDSEEFAIFDLDDVDKVFDRMTVLKYNQTIALKGKGYGITITPVPAGHMIGGTIWKIVKDGEEDIVYAVDYNHKKERHLGCCELEKVTRPSLLITDAYNMLYQQPRRSARDESLVVSILATLRSQGNVLLAVDTAGRVLEISNLLDNIWHNKEAGLFAYNIVLMSKVAHNVNEFAKSSIEWMSDRMVKSVDDARNNPFQFRSVKLCHSFEDLKKIPSPKVVLASMPDLECGFARDLFVMWCGQPNNSVIFTQRTSPGTLARYLVDNLGRVLSLQLDVRSRAPLAGKELDEYLQTKKQKASETMEYEESSEDEDEISGPVGHDIMVMEEPRRQGKKPHFPVFPFHEEKVKVDEYGEVVKHEDFLIVDGVEEAEKDISDAQEEPEEDMEIEEIPTKCMSQSKILKLNCNILYIDFEGRSDGPSIERLVFQVKPRRLIIVRGSQEACEKLSAGCQAENIWMPQKGDHINATIERHIYQLLLKDSILKDLMFKKCRESEVAWVTGQVVYDTGSTDIEKSDVAEAKKNQPHLDLVDYNLIPSHKTAFLNDIKLSDFKQILGKNGIPSEFIGGTLRCCGGNISLQRLETGKVSIEGTLSEDYFKVRDLLYEQYAII
ncbi:hypothetical protein QYM36_013011 [Artemia franciscana]|uniref:Cleavage and polyadenylation specificity factor subunit 2 n=1 Tax=Artemia franciscana TaxID=6661 RepID=A0AA88HP61_ARTSF|nr:hypothetical protein QYM36_013011 [Artemia franciscana]